MKEPTFTIWSFSAEELENMAFCAYVAAAENTCFHMQNETFEKLSEIYGTYKPGTEDLREYKTQGNLKYFIKE